jgi:soluble lytic murein transglycosylase-like protein
MLRFALTSAVLFTFDGHVLAASTAGDCESHLFLAAKEENVPPGLLYAVAMTETGRHGNLSPYAMNVEGEAVLSQSKAEAIAAFKRARESGKALIDVGCMQINHFYHASGFASVDDMFDPRLNVRYAARFLSQLRARHGSWTAAVARYHAGSANKPAQKRYVCRVLANLVKLHFGQWTDESRAFCD